MEQLGDTKENVAVFCCGGCHGDEGKHVALSGSEGKGRRGERGVAFDSVVTR